jgi:hypothetical protein
VETKVIQLTYVHPSPAATATRPTTQPWLQKDLVIKEVPAAEDIRAATEDIKAEATKAEATKAVTAPDGRNFGGGFPQGNYRPGNGGYSN